MVSDQVLASFAAWNPAGFIAWVVDLPDHPGEYLAFSRKSNGLRYWYALSPVVPLVGPYVAAPVFVELWRPLQETMSAFPPATVLT